VTRKGTLGHSRAHAGISAPPRKTLSFRPEVIELLRGVAKAQGVSMTAWIESAVRDAAAEDVP
jgi:predicted HicB family RNase H-like nuclease